MIADTAIIEMAMIEMAMIEMADNQINIGKYERI